MLSKKEKNAVQVDMTENYEERIRRLENQTSQWKPSISYYRELVALKFTTEEDDIAALERLCNQLRDLPYIAPAERTLIIPTDAQAQFADLSFTVEKVAWASDLPPEEEARSRKKFWYYP